MKKLFVIKRLEDENIRLRKTVDQLKHLYLSIKSENKELTKKIEMLSNQSMDTVNDTLDTDKKTNCGILNAKIPETKEQEVLRLREQGLSYRKIAEQTGISKSSVSNIINKK